MEWINFRHLYAFWMVCKHGGFKHAADQMYVSQSAVSEHISQLENYFDEKLFDRTTRSVNLTQTGTMLMKYADNIFRQSREINQVIKNKQIAGAPKNLNVGMVGGISRNFVFRSLSSIIRGNDEVSIDVISGAYEELMYLLRTYELDLIISIEIPQKKDLGTFGYSKIGTSPLCLAGKAKILNSSQAASKKAKTEATGKPVDVFNFKFPYKGDVIKDILYKKMKLQVSSRMETDDISLLRFFANSGQGLVIIPEVGVQEDVNSGVLKIEKLKGLPHINFYAIYLKDGIHQQMIGDFFAT